MIELTNKGKMVVNIIIIILCVIVIALILYLLYLVKVQEPKCILDPLAYAHKLTNATCFCSSLGHY